MSEYDMWIKGIWGTSAKNIYMVGSGDSGSGDPSILHYNGKTWTPMTMESDKSLLGIHGNDSNIYAIGRDTIFHLTGDSSDNSNNNSDGDNIDGDNKSDGGGGGGGGCFIQSLNK